MAHKFEAGSDTSGTAFSMMGWVNCIYGSGSWANIWAISPKHKYNSRHPSLWFYNGGRYL